MKNEEQNLGAMWALQKITDHLNKAIQNAGSVQSTGKACELPDEETGETEEEAKEE